MIDPASYDWSKFTLTFYYNAHIVRVFRTWTTAAGLESFFIERCVFSDAQGNGREVNASAEVGDAYLWKFRQEFEVQGNVTAMRVKEQFSFSFGDMHVDIFFKVVNDKTEVHLVQSQIPDSDDGRVMGHLNCRSCWTYFMTNLSAVLEHGQDLRDQNPDIGSSMKVGFTPLSQRQAD